MIYILLIAFFIWYRYPRPVRYFYVTKEHLDGHILPTPGARVTMHDLQTQWIQDVCPHNRYENKWHGPWISTHVFWSNYYHMTTPLQFWKQVKTINNLTVVLPFEIQ